jgi:exopolysaccharide biosynthesis polyprenyl glycosylphosphotransferase
MIVRWGWVPTKGRECGDGVPTSGEGERSNLRDGRSPLRVWRTIGIQVKHGMRSRALGVADDDPARATKVRMRSAALPPSAHDLLPAAQEQHESNGHDHESNGHDHESNGHDLRRTKEFPVRLVAGDSGSKSPDGRRSPPTRRHRRQRSLRRRARISLRILMVVLVTVVTAILFVGGSETVAAPAVIGIVAASAVIWLLALWGATARVQARGIDPFTAAAVGTATGMGLLVTLDWLFLDAAVGPVPLLLLGGGVFLLAATVEGLTATPLRPRPRVVFVLSQSIPAEFEQIRNGVAGRNFDYVGVVSDHEASINGVGMRRLGRSSDLLKVVSGERPDLVVVPNQQRRTAVVSRLLNGGILVPVSDLPAFYERALHRVAVMSPSWFTSVLDPERPSYSARKKRAFDVVAASTALVVFLPLFLLICLVLRISGGPVFYRQTRSGEGGKPFQVVKFRTMSVDAEVGMPVWAAQDDPRITAIGRILRKTRLDELPQFWNVLRGEMSVVGPRPERPEYLALLEREVPFWSRRLLLKPGITGWAQIHLGYTNDVSGAASKLSYDLYYLKHRSLAFDLLILIATFRLLITGRGAR